MKQTVRATWEILEVAYNEAKRDNTCIVFDKGAFEDCYSHFKNWRNLILSQYMKKEVEELDRHKIAAILTISIIESKAITYIGDLKDKVFLGSQLLAVTCGLSYMQGQLNKLLATKQLKKIERYIMPEPFSCKTNYFEIIARNLYYEENGTDLDGNKLWRLNPLQLANTYYFIELYTLEHLSIPTDVIKG
jgi:hypothetical protein